jgi:hypothetical protein
MGYNLEMQRTTSTPYILIDEEKGFMRIAGRCFHEKVGDFFREANEWLSKFLSTDFPALTIECEIDYFNSSGMKLFHNMLLKMEKKAVSGKNITVNWITTDDNVIMMECGEDFKEDMRHLNFNLVVNG